MYEVVHQGVHHKTCVHHKPDPEVSWSVDVRLVEECVTLTVCVLYMCRESRAPGGLSEVSVVLVPLWFWTGFRERTDFNFSSFLS